MRIIAGTARSIPLACPKDDSVRPAMDSTRSAIFSSLGDAVIGARALDLFSGTGSIGLEALSRGAESCVFVEKNRMSLGLLAKNMEKTKLTGEVFATDAVGCLEKFAANGRQFDLIFADPPFVKPRDLKGNLLSNPDARDFAGELLANPFLPKILAPGGTFILDSYHQDRFEIPPPWEILRDKTYGQVRVRFLVLPKA
ncbi:16S rRNA (guanine(966)-N(2))-methyltransferase RsmD [Kamptonema cortianum]|nr:16S rRNA (guanine(966)-N(2))-methyltransferase RsmD [Kamptonema cortianum]MDL5044508.1 16S rRNA (guanine(966)-N(2))-methyltransferase RsmD [Oscillatoria amoena NRMC-F 0135]